MYLNLNDSNNSRPDSPTVFLKIAEVDIKIKRLSATNALPKCALSVYYKYNKPTSFPKITIYTLDHPRMV